MQSLKAETNDKLTKATESLEEADKQYKEVEATARADQADCEIRDLGKKVQNLEMGYDEANNLKSLEVAEERANAREKAYKEQIKALTTKLKQAEARAEFADKSVTKLQKEVDRLEDELVAEQDKYKAITEELEMTFAEMSGY